MTPAEKEKIITENRPFIRQHVKQKFPKFMKTAERLMVHMTNSFFRHLYSNPRSEERSIRQNLPVGDFLAKRTG